MYIIIIVCVSIFPSVPWRRWRAGDRTLDRTINTALSCIWAARRFNNRSVCIKNTNNNNKDKELIFSPGQKRLLCWILSTGWQVRQWPRKLIVGRWAAFFFFLSLRSTRKSATLCAALCFRACLSALFVIRLKIKKNSHRHCVTQYMYILANVNYTQNSGVARNSVCITRAMSVREKRGATSPTRADQYPRDIRTKDYRFCIMPYKSLEIEHRVIDGDDP